MADFTPFRVATGFEADLTTSRGRKKRQLVIPIQAKAQRLPLRSLPNHGTGEAGPQPVRKSKQPRHADVAANEDVDDETPKGPTQAEIDAMVANALEQGRAEARSEFEAERQRFESQLAKAQEFIAEIDQQSRKWGKEVRQECGKLVHQTVERLVENVPEFVGGLLEKRCGEIAEQMVSARTVQIHVHPEDVDFASDLVGNRSGWEVIGDDTVRGGCVAKTSSGNFDGSLDAALEGLATAINNWNASVNAEETGGET